MSKNILCISFINDSIDFVEVKQSQAGSFTVSPSSAISNDSMQAVCSRADEINMVSLLPSSQFDWESFPKVQSNYLESLVRNFVQQQRPGTKVSARYHYVSDVIRSGSTKALVAMQSVESAEIEALLTLLNKFRKKIKNIYTLPTSLAGAVVQAVKPAGNTMLLWTRDNITILAIISAEGLVKISRILPYGLPGGGGPDDSHIAASKFSAEIGREVAMTVNYFKQKFREQAPVDFYLFGNDTLEKIFTDFPISNMEASLHYSLPGNALGAIEADKLNTRAHLLGSLFVNQAFNFLPVQEIQDRKANKLLTKALAALAILIGLAFLWTVRIPEPLSQGDLINQVQELRFDVQDLEESVAGLKPIEGRKKYYQSAFLDKKPEFIDFLQEIGAIVPANMVFDSFTVTPADGSSWNCTITGKIKGQDWQERLDTLREFGRALYSSSNVEIQNINHSLGQAGMDATSISFQISLQFFQGEKNG